MQTWSRTTPIPGGTNPSYITERVPTAGQEVTCSESPARTRQREGGRENGREGGGRERERARKIESRHTEGYDLQRVASAHQPHGARSDMHPHQEREQPCVWGPVRRSRPAARPRLVPARPNVCTGHVLYACLYRTSHTGRDPICTPIRNGRSPA